MKLLSLLLVVLIGCATTGGRVSIGVAGAGTAGVFVNAIRGLSCDEEDTGCRDNVRTTGIVLGSIAVAGLVSAFVFELHHAVSRKNGDDARP